MVFDSVKWDGEFVDEGRRFTGGDRRMESGVKADKAGAGVPGGTKYVSIAQMVG